MFLGLWLPWSNRKGKFMNQVFVNSFPIRVSNNIPHPRLTTPSERHSRLLDCLLRCSSRRSCLLLDTSLCSNLKAGGLLRGNGLVSWSGQAHIYIYIYIFASWVQDVFSSVRILHKIQKAMKKNIYIYQHLSTKVSMHKLKESILQGSIHGTSFATR